MSPTTRRIASGVACSSVDIRRLCGALIVGGFDGNVLPAAFAARLRAGDLGGVILFARNLTPDLDQVMDLCAAVNAAAGAVPPIISVDQEGGRVARLKHGVVQLPAARILGQLDETRIEVAGRVLGEQLAALGFSLDYAPVLDVHTHPDNPVIGDRAFGTNPDDVARRALAFARGLMTAGIAPCGKHFPGHGDTTQDSHHTLPRVAHEEARLRAIELRPFSLAASTLPAMMTAHVVYNDLDALPATLSHRVATTMLRDELGFRGVLFSDDLEMRAIADTYRAEEAAILAIEAGCDALLACSREDVQRRAHEALVERAERDARFRLRCEEAHARVLALRLGYPPRQPSREALERTTDDVRTLSVWLKELS